MDDLSENRMHPIWITIHYHPFSMKMAISGYMQKAPFEDIPISEKITVHPSTTPKLLVERPTAAAGPRKRTDRSCGLNKASADVI